MPSLLESIAFREPTRARGEIARLTAGLPSESHNRIEGLLASSPDPDRAVHYLASLKQQHPDIFRGLALSPAALEYPIAVFSYSRFLSDEILQNPLWLEQLGDTDRVLSP